MNSDLQWACNAAGQCSMHISDAGMTAIAFVVMAVMFGLGLAVFK